MKKNLFLKQKILNKLIIKGNKNTSEKIILKSTKLLQKISNKKHKNLILLALINSIPLLKNNKVTKKKLIKEIPILITNKKARISLAMTHIVQTIRENKTGIAFNKKLTQEILLASQNNSNSNKLKNELQKNVLLKKRYLVNYKWNKKLFAKYKK